ncbi:MAG: hypothetical protein E7447_04090 [Ruminococcaceae bacterium]|nr:hypothetical protein [Oscillospiraceae bacterium]
MNQTPKEKLSDFLAEMDGDLLDAAIAADTPEKLSAYEKSQRKVTPFYKRPILLRIAVIAACLALLVNVLALFSNETENPEVVPDRPALNHSVPTKPSEPFEDNPPWEEQSNGEFTIRSADMINYYAAVRLLAQQSAMKPAAMANGDYQVRFLDYENTQPPQIMPPPPPYGEGEDKREEPLPPETQGPSAEEPATVPATRPADPDDEIHYYEIDPGDTFYVSKVYFFRIEVPEDSYLAGKVGAGVVNVVISDALWGDFMITFKNGENYFSCLTNGYSSDDMDFSTHKYIEGYHVVKNFLQENASFHVSFGPEGQVWYFDENDYPNGTFPVLETTYVAEVNETFTINDLEAYFRGVKPVGV